MSKLPEMAHFVSKIITEIIATLVPNTNSVFPCSYYAHARVGLFVGGSTVPITPIFPLGCATLAHLGTLFHTHLCKGGFQFLELGARGRTY